MTVSNYSKQDICKTYNIQPSKIDVSLNGVNNSFYPTGLQNQIATRKKYSEGKDYFLFVGALHPRKNIKRLLMAFDQFKSITKSGNKLLIVGAKMWWNDELESCFDQLTYKEEVIFTGRISLEELKALYSSALAFCFVSYFEGFGIPIIEAMKCGCPVITSNCTAMPEVAGEAALLVDPYNTDSITSAMIKLNSNNELRAELSEKGLIHSQKFSWAATADALWRSIEKVLQEC